MDYKEMDAQLRETVVSRETVFHGKIFDVERMAVQLPDGTTATRDVVRHNGAVGIVAIDEQKRVLLVRQYRAAAGKALWEIPAGKLDHGAESPLACAQRELKEETGAQARHWKALFSAYSSPGGLGEVLHIFLATGLEQGEMQLDEGEFLFVQAVPLETARQWIFSGEIEDMKTIAGVLAAMANL